MLTSWAFEMEFLILGWYILVETGSVVVLTFFGSLMYLGTLVAPMFGVFGDRIGHRNLLAGMRAIYAVLATTMLTWSIRRTCSFSGPFSASSGRPISACAVRWLRAPCRTRISSAP